MKELNIRSKLIYDNHEVINVRVLNNIIFVKTIDRETRLIVWYLGFKSKLDIMADVKRVVLENHQYSNQYFKSMFKDDVIVSRGSIIVDETKFSQVRKAKSSCF